MSLPKLCGSFLIVISLIIIWYMMAIPGVVARLPCYGIAACLFLLGLLPFIDGTKAIFLLIMFLGSVMLLTGMMVLLLGWFAWLMSRADDPSTFGRKTPCYGLWVALIIVTLLAICFDAKAAGW